MPTSFLKTHASQELQWRFTVRAGLDVAAHECKRGKDSHRSGMLKPGLTLLFLLDGEGSGALTSCDSHSSPLHFTFSPKSAYLIFARTPLLVAYDFGKHGPFRALEIKVSRAFLKHLNLGSFAEEQPLPHACMIGSNPEAWVGSFLTTRLISEMALKLFSHNLALDPDPLTITTGSFNLLSATVAALREPLFCQRVKLLRDVKKLESVRDMLLERLDKSWTIKELARHIGLNEKRLKEGFRQQFGLPIYTFLQKSRLHAAREILESKDVKVIDVAMAVGYANPSRFSELFFREFGVTPSFFKSNPHVIGAVQQA
jgi:AraC-like DNA-binding protein